jgi:hypothetical protein
MSGGCANLMKPGAQLSIEVKKKPPGALIATRRFFSCFFKSDLTNFVFGSVALNISTPFCGGDY